MNDDTKLGLLNIGTASEYLGISIDTLRRWEKKGRIKPLRSPGGHRYYSKANLDDLFGKRYTRDEETLRRTDEELGKMVPQEQPITPSTPAAEIQTKEENIQPAPQVPQENMQSTAVPEIPKMYPYPEDPRLTAPSTEEQLPVSNLLHPIENQPKEGVSVGPTPLQTADVNVLIPKKDDNILTEEEIEKRINTIIRKEEKKSVTNVVLGIFALILLIANIFLVYVWFTTSRIASPLP